MRRLVVLYQLKSTRPYALVPLIVVPLVLPAGLLTIIAAGDESAASIYYGLCVELLIPAFACWWPVFVWRERIEGDGRELLYFLRRRGEGGTALLLAVLYCLLMIPIAWVGAMGGAGVAITDVFMACSRSVFLISLVFSASLMLSSGPLALILAFAFILMARWPLESLLASVGPVASLGRLGALPVAEIAFYVLASMILLALGEARSRVFTG